MAKSQRLGTIYVGIRGKLDKFKHDLRAARRESERSSKRLQKNFDRLNFNKAKNSLLSFNKLLVAGFAGYGITRVGRSFIAAANTTEQYRLTLNALLGDAEEGNRVFKDMSKFAGEVPFEFEQIMSSAAQLSGIMRGGVDEINQWMPLIADLAAVSRLSIEETTEQIVRMYSAGAGAADKFRDRGIIAMLGFKSKTAYTAKETRKILMEAFESPTSKFRGAAKKLSKTWSGTMSMIADKWFQFRNMIMEAGVYDELKKGLTDINDLFGRWIENNRELIAQRVPEYIDKIKTSAMKISDLYSGLPEGVVGAAGIGVLGRILLGGSGYAKIATTLLAAGHFAEKQALLKGLYGEKDIERMEGIQKKRYGSILDAFKGFVKGLVTEKEKLSGGTDKAIEDFLTEQYGHFPPAESFGSGVIPPKKSAPPIESDIKIKSSKKSIMALTDMWATFYDDQTKKASEASMAKAAALKSYEIPSNYKTVTALTDNWATFYNEQTQLASQASIEKWKAIEEIEKEKNGFLIGLSERTAWAMQENFSNFFYSAMEGDFNSLKDLATGVFDSIKRAFADMVAQMAVEGLFGGLTSAAIKHSGGVVGAGGARRKVPSAMFAFAPRLHGGLAPDEFPAILQRGETVIPRGGGVGANLSSNVSVNILANDAASFADMANRNPDAIIVPIMRGIQEGNMPLINAIRGIN
ncbi:MAG: hypothetical protein ACYSUK_08585 [Planctomycetota bacterium]|jgi:hypothetical protein